MGGRMNLLGDFFRAVGQLGDPRFLKVFGLSILLTLVLLGILFFVWTTLIGFILTGLAAVGYGSFIVVWGLGPF